MVDDEEDVDDVAVVMAEARTDAAAACAADGYAEVDASAGIESALPEINSGRSAVVNDKESQRGNTRVRRMVRNKGKTRREAKHIEDSDPYDSTPPSFRTAHPC